MIERQVALIEIMQDAIADAASKGDLEKVVALIDALEQLVHTWILMQQRVLEPQKTLSRRPLMGSETIRPNPTMSAADEDVARKMHQQKQQQARSIPPQPTQYVYGDGFQGVTLPTPEQKNGGYRREYVELPDDRNSYNGRNGRDMEYWEDEQ